MSHMQDIRQAWLLMIFQSEYLVGCRGVANLADIGKSNVFSIHL